MDEVDCLGHIIAIGPPVELREVGRVAAHTEQARLRAFSRDLDSHLVPEDVDQGAIASELGSIQKDHTGMGVVVRKLSQLLNLGNVTRSEDILRAALRFIEKIQGSAAKPKPQPAVHVARPDPRRDVIVQAWCEHTENATTQALTSRTAYITEALRTHGLSRLTAAEKLQYGDGDHA